MEGGSKRSVRVSEIEDDDFATLFAASEQTKRFRSGQTIEGTVVAIGADQ